MYIFLYSGHFQFLIVAHQWTAIAFDPKYKNPKYIYQFIVSLNLHHVYPSLS